MNLTLNNADVFRTEAEMKALIYDMMREIEIQLSAYPFDGRKRWLIDFKVELQRAPDVEKPNGVLKELEGIKEALINISNRELPRGQHIASELRKISELLPRGQHIASELRKISELWEEEEE